MVQCPECDIWFEVIWQNNPSGGPEYCPMCGTEMDYAECYKDESNG